MKKIFICLFTAFCLFLTGCSDLFTARDEAYSLEINTDSIVRAVSAGDNFGKADSYRLVIEGFEYSIKPEGAINFLVKNSTAMFHEEKPLSLSQNKAFQFKLPAVKKGMYAGFDLYVRDDDKVCFESKCDERVESEMVGFGKFIYRGNNLVHFDNFNKPAELDFILGSYDVKFVSTVDEFNTSWDNTGCSKLILKSDIKLSTWYYGTSEKIIDLNGHTLSIAPEMEKSQGYVFKSANCDLTIKNGRIDFNNLPEDTCFITARVNSDSTGDHTLNLENVVFTGTAAGGETGSLICSNGYISEDCTTYRASNLNIKKCKFENIGFEVEENSCVIQQNTYGKLVIKDSVFSNCRTGYSVINGSGNDTLLSNVLIKDCYGSVAGAVYQDEKGCTTLADNTVIENCTAAMNGEDNHCAAAIQTAGQVVICGAKVKAPSSVEANGTAVATIVVRDSGTLRVTDSYIHKKDDGKDGYSKNDNSGFNEITVLEQEGVTAYPIMDYGRVLLGGNAKIHGTMRFEGESGYLMMISETQPQNLTVSVNRGPYEDDNGTWNTPFGTPGAGEGLEIFEPAAYKTIGIDITGLTEFSPDSAHWENEPYNSDCPKIIYE